VGIFANLVPGIRDLRAPLAAGCVWLLAGWLALSPELPTKAKATGIYKSLLELGDVVSVVGKGAALAFTAYLVGAVSEVLGHALARAPRRVPAAVKAAVKAPFASVRQMHDAYFQVRSGAPVQPARSPSGRQVAPLLSDVALEDLTLFISDEFSQLPASVEKHPISTRDPERSEADRGTFQRPTGAKGPGRKQAPVLRLREQVMTEFSRTRRRLLTTKPELFSEIDRLRSEAELRKALALPLAALAIALAKPRDDGAMWTDLGSYDLWWLIGGAFVVTSLAWQGQRRRQEADEALVDALITRQVVAPAIERLRAELESEGATKSPASQPGRATSSTAGASEVHMRSSSPPSNP
jgi:hypothetical protein